MKIFLSLSLKKKHFFNNKYFYGANEILNCKPALVTIVGAEVEMYGVTLC